MPSPRTLCRTVLLVALLLLAGFAVLVWRAEWFPHVVAQKSYLDPMNHRVPLTAEIRRVWPSRDWRSLFCHPSYIYIRYECVIRDDHQILSAARFAFADHPQPANFSITVSLSDHDSSMTTFNFDHEAIICDMTYGDFVHWCRKEDGPPEFYPRPTH
jgi:hypothetical protein